MPRKAKDIVEIASNDILIKPKRTTKKVSETSKKASSKEDKKSEKATTKKTPVKKTTVKQTVEKKTTKKAPAKKAAAKTTTKKAPAKKAAAKTTTKKTPAKKTAAKTTTKKTPAKKTSEKTTVKKASAKKTATKTTTKKAPAKKAAAKTTTKKASLSTASQINKVEISEYYDLPYRYNQTVVKILAQTPTTLFVYWDISDTDRNNYIKQYGEYFFHNTKPVLIVHNVTNNYSFEIDINDFANSWYIHVKDSKCVYNIELGRRPINNQVIVPNNYIHVTNSNNIESPNDHILFERLPAHLTFKNVKTNHINKRSTLSLLKKVEKSYNITDFYKALYPEENIGFDRLDLNNPGSSNPSSTFK